LLVVAVVVAVVELVMEVVELVVTGLQDMDLLLYKEVHYSYHQALIQSQLVLVEHKFQAVPRAAILQAIMETFQQFQQ
jgi:hypothetical protein